MPRSRDSRSVLIELKNLSTEADHLADNLPKVSDLDPFFDSIKANVLRIKECSTLKSLKEISIPHDLSYYLHKEESEEKVKIVHTPETQKEHVHSEKTSSSVYRTGKKDLENGREVKIVAAVCKSSKKERAVEAGLPTPGEKSNSKINQQTPKLPKISYNLEETPTLFKTPCNTQLTNEKISAPVLNRTLVKGGNPTPTNKKVLSVAEETFRVTRSGSRKKQEEDISELVILKETSSALRTRLQGDENKNSQVRSGAKRKSTSSNENQKNKKPKKEVKDKSHTSQSKSTLKSNVLRPANGSTHNPKPTAVIVPSLNLKHSITSDVTTKEKKLEEIQKKEEKANENRKKVLADRQLKAEEQKKKREEKMEKALQKRLLLDKEKDLDRSVDVKKSQAKVLAESVKKPIQKQKNKEVQEQQVPETDPAQGQKEAPAQTSNKTPQKSNTSDSETYDLTPAPDSSTYDFSDDEENVPNGKPIPSWASGILLKQALIQQFYNPPNPEEIFGNYIEAPDLSVLFGVTKNYYYKRTSSAVWNTTPY